MKIIQCDKCGKMFKIPWTDGNIFHTDLNGRFVFENGKATCLTCHNISTFNMFETEDWIADLVFTIGIS